MNRRRLMLLVTLLVAVLVILAGLGLWVLGHQPDWRQVQMHDRSRS